MNKTASTAGVLDVFKDSAMYFPTQLQQWQFFDKYSRFNYEKNRRETWVETVDRAVNFLRELSHNILSASDYDRIREAILRMEVAPSMRLLAMAGPAATRNNICIYNCSAIPIDSIDSFVEVLLVSMAGTGVGYSVEKQYINKLPIIIPQTGVIRDIFVVPDTTEGWGEAFKIGLEVWFSGEDIEFDYSQIRPIGTPLNIKGGTASGPEPLKKLLDFTRTKILNKQTEQLSTLNVHDIVCMIGNCVISGAVRRSALISLFDFDDLEMRNCKNGDFEAENSQRWFANNSAVWNKPLTQVEIMEQMLDMFKGNRGEPGIFSRIAANKTKPHRRTSSLFQTNPCGEISLRPYQFCNLSQIIARPKDTIDILMEKAEVATIIGTIQAMATNFPGLRAIWKQNCEEEALLGVDLNGQADTPLVRDIHIMQQLKEKCIEINIKYAKILNINRAAAITCVKPNGNSSVLYDCSSGLHPRFAKYYIRNIRIGTHTPIYKVLKECQVPMSPENGQEAKTATTWVAHFPIKAPDGAIIMEDVSAVDQCKTWYLNKMNFTEHNPSITITYREDEVLLLTRWIYEHQDIIGGMSFLPSTKARYNQMPYEEITKEEYYELVEQFPKIDFSLITKYEKKDLTTSSMEIACASGQCEWNPDNIDFSKFTI